MKNISFEITGLDIRDYLIQHKSNEIIKNREAMFVKYMKENNIITQESLEILMKKYNWDEKRIYGTYRIGNNTRILDELSSFDSYLKGVKNLDISGICHIMIPCIQYYSNYSEFRHFIYLSKLDDIVEKLGINQYDKQEDILLDSIDNYTLVGQIEDFENTYRGFSRITMSKDKSRKLLQAYSQIYGEEPVKQIRKMIRERV